LLLKLSNNANQNEIIVTNKWSLETWYLEETVPLLRLLDADSSSRRPLMDGGKRVTLASCSLEYFSLTL